MLRIVLYRGFLVVKMAGKILACSGHLLLNPKWIQRQQFKSILCSKVDTSSSITANTRKDFQLCGESKGKGRIWVGASMAPKMVAITFEDMFIPILDKPYSTIKFRKFLFSRKDSGL